MQDTRDDKYITNFYTPSYLVVLVCPCMVAVSLINLKVDYYRDLNVGCFIDVEAGYYRDLNAGFVS